MTGGLVAATARRLGWRLVLGASGGLRVRGKPTGRPCILVANHSSHADTVALLAAVPARRRPMVAAATDYWFTRPDRAAACRVLVGGFPVRRSGGGSADLTTADDLLAAGHDIIIYPEGTRTRDGSIGEFRSGAARLAARTGAPLVPVAITGTRTLLPAHGRVHRSRVTVHIGAPVAVPADARAAVADLLDTAAPAGRHRRDSRLRRVVARFASAPRAVALVLAWAVAEALSWPLLPEFLLGVLVVAATSDGRDNSFRRAGLVTVRLTLAAAAGSLAGGALMYALAAHGTAPPAPLTTPRMHAAAASQLAAEGAAGVRHQPFSGIPYKVYAAAAGRADVGLPEFLGASVTSRTLRIAGVGLVFGLFGWLARPWRRWYPAYLVLAAGVFAVSLADIVASWR